MPTLNFEPTGSPYLTGRLTPFLLSACSRAYFQTASEGRRCNSRMSPRAAHSGSGCGNRSLPRSPASGTHLRAGRLEAPEGADVPRSLALARAGHVAASGHGMASGQHTGRVCTSALTHRHWQGRVNGSSGALASASGLFFFFLGGGGGGGGGS